MRWALAFVVAELLCLAGCGGGQGGASVLLSLSASASIAAPDVARIVELDVDVRGAETFTHANVLGRSFSASRVERVLYQSRARAGQLEFTVTAVDRDHQFIGYGTTTVTLAGDKTVPAMVGLVSQRPPDVDRARSTLTVDQPSGLYANGSDKATITATIVGADGRPQRGLTVQLSVSGNGNTLTGPLAPTNDDGVATATLASVVAEHKVITAIVSPGVSAVTLPMQAGVTFAQTRATRLVFTHQPTDTVAGQPLATEVTVEDPSGVPVPGTFPITLTLSATPQHASLMGDVIQSSDAGSGTAHFALLRVNLVGSGYQLTASAPGLTSATSATFDVHPGPWFEVNTGMWSATLSHVWPDPVHGGTAYAGSANGAVWRTTDGGFNWYSADNGLGGHPGSIGYDPNDPLTQWADDAPPTDRVAAGGALYRTTNGGAAWLRLSPQGNVSNFNGPILVDPANSKTIYVSCTIGDALAPGICKSTDGGATFADASTGMDLVTYLGGAVALLADPHAGALYVALNNDDHIDQGTGFGDGSKCAVYKSVDQGAGWSVVYSGTSGCYGLALDPGTGNLWLSNQDGVSELPAGGNSWLLRNDGRADVAARAITLAPGNPTAIYVNTDGASYKSTDEGAHWTAMAPLISHGTLLGADAGGSVVYISDAQSVGMQRSADAGAHFADASVGLRNATIDAFALTPQAPAKKLVATGRGLTWWSFDGGATWMRTAGTLSGVNRIVFNGEADTQVFAATATGVYSGDPAGGWSSTPSLPGTVADLVPINGTNRLYATLIHGGGVFESTNGGYSWTNVDSIYIGGARGTRGWSITADWLGTLYACVDDSADDFGLYKSTNGGISWTSLPGPYVANFWFTRMLVDPTSTSTLYGLDSKLYRSTDGGQSWSLFSDSFGPSAIYGIYELAVDYWNNDIIYASATDGVHVTRDGGKSWTLAADGPPPAQLDFNKAGAIAIDQTNSMTVYAASETHGIYKTLTGGQ